MRPNPGKAFLQPGESPTMWFEGNRSGTAGRARLSQAGGAGTKAERGHSCPQQCRTEVKLSDVPILLGIRELLRTRMSALRWRPQNLRALRTLSHIVIQRAEVRSGSRDGALGQTRPTTKAIMY